MIQKCGKDYNYEAGKPHCGIEFEDADRWTLCPHPKINDPRGRQKILRWEKAHGIERRFSDV